MNTALKHTAVANYRSTSPSAWSTFINWCNDQEENRFLWLAIGVAGHGCVVTPLTLLAVMLAGNPMFFWPFAIGAMAMCLVSNLAAMPTKITIPVLFLSLFIDLAIIISSIAIAFPIAH
ncbi:MAG TPA: hypothetical protein VFI06_08990 [Chitinophagaceae bacterium]|nr:hypothetical protein [Chitinophagaceae bacterium]